MSYTKGVSWSIAKHAVNMGSRAVGWVFQIRNGNSLVADLIDSKDNAQLIAAAPDMYEALLLVKKHLDHPYSDAWNHAVDTEGKVGLGEIIDKAIARTLSSGKEGV